MIVRVTNLASPGGSNGAIFLVCLHLVLNRVSDYDIYVEILVVISLYHSFPFLEW